MGTTATGPVFEILKIHATATEPLRTGCIWCRAGWIAARTTALCLRFDSPTLGPHFPIPRPIALLSGHVTLHWVTSHCIGSHHIRLGCVTARWVTSLRVGLHHLVSGHITSHQVASPRIGSHHLMSGRITLCQVASPCVRLCHIALGHIASCWVASHCVRSHRIVSGRIALCQVASHCIGSRHIMSGHIASGRVSRAIIRSHCAIINPIWCAIPPCYYSPSCTLSSCSFCEGLAFTYTPPYLASVTVTLGTCPLL